MKKQDLMQSLPISRRVFNKLSLSGILTMAAPLRQAYAQTGQTGNAKRFVAFIVPGGVWHPAYCAGNNNGIEFGDGVKPLAPHKDQIVAFKNLINTAAGNSGVHPRGNSTILTGFHASARSDIKARSTELSIDQIIANHVGKNSFFKSIEAGIFTNTSLAAINRVVYSAPETPRVPINKPSALFNKLFSGGGGSGSSGSPDSARRILVLDAIKDQIAMMEQELTGDDRARMQQHVNAIDEVEQRIKGKDNATSTPECMLPSDAPAVTGAIKEAELMADLSAQALICGLTNVATVQVDKEGCSLTYDFLKPWTDAYGSRGKGHHGATHDRNWRSPSNSDLKAFIGVDWFWADKVARMLDLLDSVPEDGGTMLDNTVFFFGSSLSTPSNHRTDDMRWLLIGGKGLGRWKTNRFVDAKGENAHNLHVSMLQAFGINQSTFGDKKAGNGPLSVL